jgi:hypothetical protein
MLGGEKESSNRGFLLLFGFGASGFSDGGEVFVACQQGELGVG